MRFTALLLLCTFALTGCEGKAKKVQHLQDQYNAEYAPYAQNCVNKETEGSAIMLTGKKLTSDEIAALEAKKKEREARCKPQADHLADLQRQIIAAQQ
jgi:hypothetical protein